LGIFAIKIKALSGMKRILFGVLCIIPSVTGIAQKRDFLSNVYNYIENTSVYEWNQEEGHVPLVSYATTQEALARDREKSAGFLSLDGTWKFYYAETPEGTPAGFFETDFEDSD